MTQEDFIECLITATVRALVELDEQQASEAVVEGYCMGMGFLTRHLITEVHRVTPGLDLTGFDSVVLERLLSFGVDG